MRRVATGRSTPAAAGSRRLRPGRVALMRTAIGLMGKDGYEGTSTRDIAAAAGVSVAALYYHFPSKLDLLRQFLHEAHDVVLARLRREVGAAAPGGPQAQLDAAVATLVASNLHDEWARLAAQVAEREHARLDEPDRLAIAAKREAIVDLIAEVVEAGVAAGDFTTTEAREVAWAVLTLASSSVQRFPAPGTTLADVTSRHQRFARALATGPAGPAPARRRARGQAPPAAR